jgi:Calx-beta domain/Domain of unknown function (DUF4114)/RTX calcium-binding nonapeptide repeat (4 copies)
MAFSFSAKTTFTGFTAAEQATILATMQTAYDGSATAKTMFDTWIDAGNIIQISNVPGVFQAYTTTVGTTTTGTGRVEIDLSYISDLSYINDTGKPVLHSLLGALVHELGHGLTGRRDNISETDYQGANVRYVNTIWSELGLDKEISYIAQARNDLHKVGYQYTNGAKIDASRSGDSTDYKILGLTIPFVRSYDWNSGTLGKSNDLLIGGPSANRLQSGEGNDFLFGAGGNDTLEGGSGKDTAVYFGTPLDYDIKKNLDGSWAVNNVRGAKDAGSDTLKNVEVVQFDGGNTYDLKKNGLTFQTDFALVIDTTGSMGSSIGSVKAQASALIDAVFAGGKNDGRIGVVGFKDTTNGEPSQVILPFTDQDDFAARKSAAITAINGITVSGGGDLPETAYDGLRTALNGSMGQWRFGAGALRIALFTDAAAKDGVLAGEVNALAKRIGATITKTSSLASVGGSVDTFSLARTSADVTGANLFGSDDPNASENFPVVLSDEPIDLDPTTAEVQIFTIFTGSPDLGVDTTDLAKAASDNGGTLLAATTNDELVKKLFEIINAPPVSVIPIISIAVGDPTAVETKTGETANPGQFTLTRTGLTTADLLVNYTLTGTATNSTDYQNLTGTATFKAGSDKITIDLNSIDDNIYEDTETVILTLTDGGTNYTLAPIKTGTVTIADNEAKPTISIVNISQPEGNSGNTNYGFNLTLSNPSVETITVKYITADDTAIAGSDYTATTGTVTFAPGETTKAVNVLAIGDELFEVDESFKLNLSEAVNATILTTSATGTITNDDVVILPVISLAISDADAAEPANPGQFILTRTGITTSELAVNYALTGTAINGTDYQTLTNTVTFKAGSNTATVDINSLDDNIYEGNETVTLTLADNAAAYKLAEIKSGTVTIVENETKPVVCISDAYPESGEEGDPEAAHREFDIYLSHASTKTITVEYATADGTAVGDSDFDPIAPTTLTFAPGETCKTISVAVYDDNVYEQKESFIVELTNPTNATIELGYDYGIAKIIDDDLPGVSIDCPDKEAGEVKTGKSNSGKFSFKRTGSTTDALEVKYTIEGNATNGTDYTKVADTITFEAGSDTSTIEINPIYDGISEGTESITLKLSDSDNYTVVGDKSETANITDSVLPLVLPVKNIDRFKTPVGTGFQGKPEGEVIDLRGFAGQTLKVDTVSVGDAAYQNYIGFYAVEDAQGTLANGLKVGDAGYAQAAIKSAILRAAKIETQSDRTVTGGKIFAPVVIANGTFEEFLNRNPQNQANSDIHAYFNYTGANTDKVDHFRLLGDNKFGVEDLYGGGDRDYNDIVVQLTVKG